MFRNSSQDFTCPNIQTALEFSKAFSSNCSVIIYLPPGEQIISYPVSITSSMRIIGNKNKSRICCDYTRSDLPIDTLHTIYFNRSSNVYMNNFFMYNCSLPLRFDTSRKVEIENITISYFQEAALDIYNCENVLIADSHFKHNIGTGIIKEAFRGNTGAVSIGYYNFNHLYENPVVRVINTMFCNNSALTNDSFRSTSNAFFSGVLTGRAGGLGVFISEAYHNVTVHINGCIFQSNYAQSFGGGLYFVYSGNSSKTQYKGFVSNSQFINNIGVFGGGGFIVTIQSSGPPNVPHMLRFQDCHFERNRGDAGGGIYFYVIFPGGRGNLFELKGSSFVDNGGVNPENEFGSALAASFYEVFENKVGFPIHFIEDCTFINNTGSNGIVSLGYVPFNLTGTNQFIGNTGSALRAIGSRLTVGGELHFINNTVDDGGALYLLSFAQIILSSGTKMLFQGNRGRYGASIFVNAADQSKVFKHLLHNPQCFLLPYPDQRISPAEWNQDGINITFMENRAWFGSAIFISSITSCLWTGIKPYFNISYFREWPIFSFRNDNNNTGFEDSFNQMHSLTTSAIKVVGDRQISGWPGQELELNVRAINELGDSTGSLTRLLFNYTGDTIGPEVNSSIRLNPDTFLVSEEPYKTNVKYSIRYEDISLDKTQNIGNISIQHTRFAVQDSNSAKNGIPLVVEGCLGGCSLSSLVDASSFQYCSCEKNQRQVILCEDDQDSVIIEAGQWAVRVRGEEQNLHFYTCPPGYCQCLFNTSIGPTACTYVYSNTQPDRQCACNRKGILCGQCTNNKGFSVLLNQCITCEKANILWIFVIVFVDVILFLVIVLVDRPFPSWIYPVIFYIQIAPLVTQYFPVTFSNYGKYLYYISSALGFYFPFDFCLHEDMNALISYALRFLPALIGSFVLPSIILINSCLIGKKIKNFTFPVLKMNGVWSIVLLIYTNTLYNAMSILNCPLIPNELGNYNSWYFAGSVRCFNGGHIPLGIAAIVVLIVCVLLVPFAFFVAYKEPSEPRWIYQISQALKKPFVSQFSWWIGSDLVRKLIVLLFIATFPGNETLLILLLSVLIGIYGYLKPYKSKLTNGLELITLILFLILLMMRTNSNLQDRLSVFPMINKTLTTSLDDESCNRNTTLPASYTTDFAKLLLLLYYIAVVPIFFVALGSTVFSLWQLQKYVSDTIRKANQRRHSSIGFMTEFQAYEISVPTTYVSIQEED